MPASLIDRLYAERVGVSGVITGQDLVNLILSELRPSYASASLVGQNGNQAAASYALDAGLETVGTGWTAGASDFTLAVDASVVEITGMATYDYEAGDANAAAEQRVSPILEIWKNGALIQLSATGYQRHTSGHNDSSNTVVFTDLSPAVGDVWEIRMSQGSTQNDVMNVTQGHFTVKAVL